MALANTDRESFLEDIVEPKSEESIIKISPIKKGSSRSITSQQKKVKIDESPKKLIEDEVKNIKKKGSSSLVVKELGKIKEVTEVESVSSKKKKSKIEVQTKAPAEKSRQLYSMFGGFVANNINSLDKDASCRLNNSLNNSAISKGNYRSMSKSIIKFKPKKQKSNLNNSLTSKKESLLNQSQYRSKLKKQISMLTAPPKNDLVSEKILDFSFDEEIQTNDMHSTMSGLSQFIKKNFEKRKIQDLKTPDILDSHNDEKFVRDHSRITKKTKNLMVKIGKCIIYYKSYFRKGGLR